MISQPLFQFSAVSSQWAKRGSIALLSLLSLTFEPVPLQSAPLPNPTPNLAQLSQRQLSEARPRRSSPSNATSAPTNSASPRPLLKQGSQGEAVSELQAMLRLLGYYTGAIDGDYQDSTASAVAAFQRSAGLQADGVAGTETWVRLLPPSPVAEAATPAASPAPSPTPTLVASPAPSSVPSPAPSPAPAASPAPSTVPSSSAAPASPTSASTLPSFTTPSPAASPSSPSSAPTAPAASSGSASFPTPSALPSPAPAASPSPTPSPSQPASLPAASPVVRSPAATPAVTVPAPAATPASPAATPAPAQAETQPAAPASTSTETSIEFPILRVGMRGSAVNGLQMRLQAIGVFSGTIDGVFGAETQEAVKAAQRNFNLDADGVVGSATWAALMK